MALFIPLCVYYTEMTLEAPHRYTSVYLCVSVTLPFIIMSGVSLRIPGFHTRAHNMEFIFNKVANC